MAAYVEHVTGVDPKQIFLFFWPATTFRTPTAEREPEIQRAIADVRAIESVPPALANTFTVWVVVRHN